MSEERIAALEKRVADLEAIIRELTDLPEPDPIVVGTEAFRQVAKVKRATLQRRA